MIKKFLQNTFYFNWLFCDGERKNIICYSLNCGWNDIGSWDGLSKVLKKYSDKKVFQLNSKKTLLKVMRNCNNR